MMGFRILLYVFFLLPVSACVAQKQKSARLSRADKVTVENLQQHVIFLSDDKLEGRRAGSPGEKLAMEYIAGQLKQIGVEPRGTRGYFQPFDIYEGKQFSPGSSLRINGQILEPGRDFFPFPWSDNKQVTAEPALSIQEADMPWFMNLAELLEENSNNPHFDPEAAIKERALEVVKKKGTALLVYNTSETTPLSFNSRDRSQSVSIPVIYINKEAALRFFSDAAATLQIDLAVKVTDKFRQAHNVVGYINNNAARTIVVGAHYDHLGYGEDGNSMIRGGEPAIHNGADDNASGTAALIELARILKSSRANSHNYLFIAFSGEELGLNGSKFFVENPTIDLGSVNYMINMDMVGRLNDSSRVLTIGGIGTSPQWAQVVPLQKHDYLKFKVDSSGTGPSDHTSFYRKQIPVLFFFTGLHSDYHRPGDDADKINYQGQYQILRLIQEIIENSGRHNQKLTFTPTREVQTTTSARFSVSLGVMPDYTFTGTGVRIDGVSEGRAAQKAGMKAGDIIIQLGEHPVTSMEQYMQALSKFKKGDQTTVRYKRAEAIHESSVQF